MGQASKLRKWLFAITAFSLLAGLILSIVSWLRLCSGACAESHNWRFFGGTFENLGLLFFCSCEHSFLALLEKSLALFPGGADDPWSFGSRDSFYPHPKIQNRRLVPRLPFDCRKRGIGGSLLCYQIYP